MSDALFKTYVIGMLLLCWLTAESAAQNALEAHRHTHELGCHVQAANLCKFHEGE
jgi:hypothetical protein